MSSERPAVTVKDLVEEAKKRAVFLAICVVGLSYLLSLTSSSVWVNLPAAASLIVAFRYISLDFEMKRRAAAYIGKPISGSTTIDNNPFDDSKASLLRPDWRKKVKSLVVENAIDHFTRRLVCEWVTDLWYSKLSPDKEGPEELVQIINGVIGEISRRMRNINLIDLLTRDVIHRVCNHLELYRECQAKIAKKNVELATFDQRDRELKLILAAENRLHPALFSPEAEHKVLQHLMEGLISLTFKLEDLQCSFFRYAVRELLSCAVMRPVINLANPRFINERIEQVVVSVRNAKKGAQSVVEMGQGQQNGPPKISADHFSRDLDPSVSGVELVQFNRNPSKKVREKPGAENVNGKNISKDPLLSVDARSSRSWSSLPSQNLEGDGKDLLRSTSGGEWGDMLDYFSRKKTQALAPENFENMWTKGRDYQNKEVMSSHQAQQRGSSGNPDISNISAVLPKIMENDGAVKGNHSNRGAFFTGSKIMPGSNTRSAYSLLSSDDENSDEEVIQSDSSSYYSSENEEKDITGLDTPTTQVWRKNRNLAVSRIRHPLESKDGKLARKASRENNQRPPKIRCGRQKTRVANKNLAMWQEVERTSFVSGDGQDILSPLKLSGKDEDSSEEYDLDVTSRVQSGAAASSSTTSLPETYKTLVKTPQSPFFGNTFSKLRCEVLGANIVKSSSKLFAVYSISVADGINSSWSIKRRYRHFEELHRRLKEYPEYDLHLPPKHFLSTGLDIPVIRERCKLLDKYLKMLLQLPTVSGSIEVWDFLSVDSQTYAFSSTFSIVETLSVDMNNKPRGDGSVTPNYLGTIVDSLKIRSDATSEDKDRPPLLKGHSVADDLKSDVRGKANSPTNHLGSKHHRHSEYRGADSDTRKHNGNEKEDKDSTPEDSNDSNLPTEWIPPNLSAPMLDLVDVIFQLQEGGWIRRKAFWVAKQMLQLGMGDALDDWLIEKIQLLRRGSVVASGITRVEQILWPDGIFLTKHPKRRRPPAPITPQQTSSSPQNFGQVSSPKAEDVQKFEEEQRQEAERRAQLVYELLIDNAPAAVVSLVGRKEYEQCAKDLYFFLQSSVCLKQLMLELFELVLLSAFPELHHSFKQLHDDKDRFGEFNPS